MLALILTAGLIIKFGTHEKVISDNWKQELIAQNKQNQKMVAQMSGDVKNYYQERIAKNEYRIDHNLKPTTGKTFGVLQMMQQII
ncbi:hypothetical protein [Terrilactibacillus laevilacticus]|uniref:Uncharacterized protein n=1 Tax=Terrilactibacillus laevilacticus TaxID=1380157 RepID=A0ABW5PQ81_9BACI|nr:hypothetical protein [Terrilactibacillus laevilacticus]